MARCALGLMLLVIVSMNFILEVAAAYMLDELEDRQLEVIKVPGYKGGYIRAVICCNPDWYRQFCAAHVRIRNKYPRPRTYIKRCHTVRALNRIMTGNTAGIYAARLLPYIESYAREVLGVKP